MSLLRCSHHGFLVKLANCCNREIVCRFCPAVHNVYPSDSVALAHFLDVKTQGITEALEPALPAFNGCTERMYLRGHRLVAIPLRQLPTKNPYIVLVLRVVLHLWLARLDDVG